jgi:hypothetical protein
MASNPLIVTLTAAEPIRLAMTPFIAGAKVKLSAAATPTVYGVYSPARSSLTKYQSFKQTISGNKHFLLNSAIATPQNTTGGALSDANQLRVVTQVNRVLKKRARGDQVAPASGSIVAAGGGTAAGDATYTVKGTTTANLAVGSVLLSAASSGANTKTILPGDSFTIAGDTTTYYATGGGTLTFNGTTEINIGITPPLQVAQTAGLAITVAAASGKGIMLAEAPAVSSIVETWVLEAADITTLTGGALVAARPYEIDCRDVMLATTQAELLGLAR